MASEDISLVEDDISVSLQILEKLSEREMELHREIERILKEREIDSNLMRKLENDRMRVAQEEKEVEARMSKLVEVEAEKETLLARVASIETQLAEIEASVRGEPEEPGDDKCDDMAEQLAVLEKTLEQKRVRLANRERTIAEKRKQLSEAKRESMLMEFMELKTKIANEEARRTRLTTALADVKENMKRVLSRRDMGDGSGIYARHLVIAELAQGNHAEEEDVDVEEEEDDLEILEIEKQTIEQSLKDLRMLRKAREAALKQELECIVNNAYLRTLRDERDELERSFLEKL